MKYIRTRSEVELTDETASANIDKNGEVMMDQESVLVRDGFGVTKRILKSELPMVEEVYKKSRELARKLELTEDEIMRYTIEILMQTPKL